MNPAVKAKGLDYKECDAEHHGNGGQEKALFPKEEQAEDIQYIAAQGQDDLSITEEHIAPSSPHANQPEYGRQEHENYGQLSKDALSGDIKLSSWFFLFFLMSSFRHLSHLL
jgi:hypothetical protein